MTYGQMFYGLVVLLAVLALLWLFFGERGKPAQAAQIPVSAGQQLAVVLSRQDEIEPVDCVDGEVVDDDEPVVPRGTRVTAFFSDQIDYFKPEAQAMLDAGWMYDSNQHKSNGRDTVAVGLPSLAPDDPRNPKSWRDA